MKISSIIADILQIINRSHGDLQDLGADDHTQYLKEKASSGLASETPVHNHQAAANCGKLDHGAALDGKNDDDHTQYLDVAGTRPPINIKHGIYSALPANCYVGDIYLATDTNQLFVCNTNQVWTEKGAAAALLGFEVSDNLKASADAEQTEASQSYNKQKEITVACIGTIRIKFDLKITVATNTAYGRIYINGVAVGTQRTNATTSYVNFSEDIAVIPGDKVQLYSYASAADAKVENFRLYWDLAEVNGYTIITD